jgi:hypothetical protein
MIRINIDPGWISGTEIAADQAGWPDEFLKNRPKCSKTIYFA